MGAFALTGWTVSPTSIGNLSSSLSLHPLYVTAAAASRPLRFESVSNLGARPLAGHLSLAARMAK